MRDALRACLAREQQAAGGGVYGRQEAATELARLITEASASRDVADLDDESLFASGLEAHELGVPPSGGKPRP
jgi:serine/threonine-protein kinase